MASQTPEFRSLNVHFWDEPQNTLQAGIITGLQVHMLEQGVVIQQEPTKETNLVVTCAEMFRDVPYRQTVLARLPHDIDRYQVKILGVSTIDQIPAFEDMDPDYLDKLGQARPQSPVLAVGYPQLPLVGCTHALIVEGNENSSIPHSAHLIGLEQSHPQIGINRKDFYSDLFDKLKDQATAQLVVHNEVLEGIVLPYDLWLKSQAPEAIIPVGKQMKELGMYPERFPLERFVSKEKRDFFRLLLKLTGLSYGNTSMRALGEEAEYGKFWMSESGVKKDDLQPNQIRLARGLIPGTNKMGTVRLSGVPQTPTGRISVDAIEAEQIYDGCENVNVTSHGHVWINDPETGRPLERSTGYREIDGMYVVCTERQYPCGSFNLGQEAMAAASRSPDPTRTIILERRHGLVVLAENYGEMFKRIRSLYKQGFMTSNIPQD